jgi:phosphoenolpyruvate synthase/pyruvate phosphate dikinase
MAYVLFISEEKLKDSTAINLNVDVNLLLPHVRQAQKLYVETKLGTELTQKLKDEITAGTLAGAYKTLVDEYIGDMLPNWAFYHAIPFLRFKIENGNIYSKT